MKITCQACQAKYTIADEKVAGKTVKIKCKKCSATIIVQGNEVAAPIALEPPAPPEAPRALLTDNDDDEGATKVFTGTAPAESEWTVNFSDDDQRSMTTEELVREMQRGSIPNDVFVWKDGMADWLPVASVPELSTRVIPRASPVPTFSNAVVKGAAAKEAPVTTKSAQGNVGAARRVENRVEVDLFSRSAAAPAHTGAAEHEKQIGERNETSVLFSLSALTGGEAAKRKGDDGRGTSGAAAKKNGRVAFDDLMNLGAGGISGGAMLAPPPLLAPVVEAVAGPAVAARPAVVAPVTASAGEAFTPFQDPPAFAAKPKSGKLAAIVFGVAAVVACVVTFFAMRGSRPEPPASHPDQAATVAVVAPVATAAPAPVVTAAPAVTAAPPPQAPDTAAVAATTTAPAPPSAPPAPIAAAPAAKSGGDTAGFPAKSDRPAFIPPPDKPAAPDPTPAAAGREFDRSAAIAALNKAAASAKSCKKDDGPTGSGKVRITFATSGAVTSAVMEGAPFAGTPVGNCIAGRFRSVHVPPFDGSPVAVPKSITLN